jgi:hypothetical protein
MRESFPRGSRCFALGRVDAELSNCVVTRAAGWFLSDGVIRPFRGRHALPGGFIEIGETVGAPVGLAVRAT